MFNFSKAEGVIAEICFQYLRRNTSCCAGITGKWRPTLHCTCTMLGAQFAQLNVTVRWGRIGTFPVLLLRRERLWAHSRPVSLLPWRQRSEWTHPTEQELHWAWCFIHWRREQGLLTELWAVYTKRNQQRSTRTIASSLFLWHRKYTVYCGNAMQIFASASVDNLR